MDVSRLAALLIRAATSGGAEAEILHHAAERRNWIVQNATARTQVRISRWSLALSVAAVVAATMAYHQGRRQADAAWTQISDNRKELLVERRPYVALNDPKFLTGAPTTGDTNVIRIALPIQNTGETATIGLSIAAACYTSPDHDFQDRHLQALHPEVVHRLLPPHATQLAGVCGIDADDAQQIFSAAVNLIVIEQADYGDRFNARSHHITQSCSIALNPNPTFKNFEGWAACATHNCADEDCVGLVNVNPPHTAIKPSADQEDDDQSALPHLN